MTKTSESKPIADLTNEELQVIKKKNRGAALNLITSREIRDIDFPEIEFLVDGFIPATGLTLLCGASKIGKSWLILQLLHALSSGGDFLGKVITKKRFCLYLALEDTLCRLKNREIKMGVAPTDNLFVVTTIPPNEAGIKVMRDTLHKYPEISVVVIDTYGRFASGRIESNFQNDYDWMSKLKALADECEIALILVHHTRKLRDEIDMYNEIQGTTANMAVSDSVLLLTKNRFSNDGELSCTSRDYEAKTVSVGFDIATCTWKLRDTSKPQASTPERQRILEVLEEYGEMPPAEIGRYIKSTAKNISNILSAMQKEGLVAHGSKRGYWKAVEKNPKIDI